MRDGDTVVIDGEVSLLNTIDGGLDLNAEIDGDTGAITIIEKGGATLRPATRTTLGGVIVGEDLQITQGGVLSVVKADKAEMDNTRPITSAAVYTEIGNIDALLRTI